MLISMLCNGCAATKPLPAKLTHYLKSYNKISYSPKNNPWMRTGIVLDEGDFVQVCVTGEITIEAPSGSYSGNRFDSGIWLKGRIGKNGKKFKLLKPNHTGYFLAKDIKDEDDFEIGYVFDNAMHYQQYYTGNLKVDILVWKKDDPEFVLAGLEELHKLYPKYPRIRRLLANQKSMVAFEVLAETDFSRAVKSLKQNIAFREKDEKLHRVELYDIAKDYYRLYLMLKNNSTRKDKKAHLFSEKKPLKPCTWHSKNKRF